MLLFCFVSFFLINRYPQYWRTLAPMAGWHSSKFIVCIRLDIEDSLKVGDRVVVYPWTGCGKCGFCTNKCYDKCPM